MRLCSGTREWAVLVEPGAPSGGAAGEEEYRRRVS